MKPLFRIASKSLAFEQESPNLTPETHPAPEIEIHLLSTSPGILPNAVALIWTFLSNDDLTIGQLCMEPTTRVGAQTGRAKPGEEFHEAASPRGRYRPGVVGASVLSHLAREGWRDICLIERSGLTAGSSWHAAGGFQALNAARVIAPSPHDPKGKAMRN